jgi:hypothetical protein
MKKINYFIVVGVIGIFILAGYFFGKAQTSKIDSTLVETKTTTNEQTTSDNSIPANWKTYTSERIPVTFKYPDTWTKQGEESNTINRKGEVMSISLYFIDSTTQSFFSLAFHVAPYGAEVYKIAEDEYNSSKSSNQRDAKQITVAGNNSYETFTTMSKDIKGNIYDPALKLIHIVFLDKQKTGGFNVNFRTPEPGSEKEIAKFNQLLSTFKFNN